MKERLIELLKSSSQYMCEQSGLVETIADYLLANGVIVLPCAVGDTVWCVVDKVFNEPLEAKIYSITIQAEGTIMRCGVKGYYGVSYMATDIGKKFFKTKEEAEKALERSDGR